MVASGQYRHLGGTDRVRLQDLPSDQDEDFAGRHRPSACLTAPLARRRPLLPLESVDPIRIAEGYHLQPAGQIAAKPYTLLVEALSRSAKVAVAKYAWSGRERLGLLRVRDDVLVLHAMRRPDEIRDPAKLLPPPTAVSEAEIAGALALMDTMTVDALEGPSSPTATPRRSLRASRRNGRRSHGAVPLAEAATGPAPLTTVPRRRAPLVVVRTHARAAAAGGEWTRQTPPRRASRACSGPSGKPAAARPGRCAPGAPERPAGAPPAGVRTTPRPGDRPLSAYGAAFRTGDAAHPLHSMGSSVPPPMAFTEWP
ncbi:Ku protein [Streptomyces eurythermus]|uniref:Ku protein n=1 Tax=Streptomyces eurythermus TaxID=42237 RepID=UPI0036B33CD0